MAGAQAGQGLLLPVTQLSLVLWQYVRVSSDTPSSVIYHLMTQHWGLDVPNLLISVTGGAKNFNMKLRLKSIFRRGLVKVAQTTGGCWALSADDGHQLGRVGGARGQDLRDWENLRVAEPKPQPSSEPTHRPLAAQLPVTALAVGLRLLRPEYPVATRAAEAT